MLAHAQLLAAHARMIARPFATCLQSMIFMVCDGHMGVKCADFVVDNFLDLLKPKLPRKLPNESNDSGER